MTFFIFFVYLFIFLDILQRMESFSFEHRQNKITNHLKVKVLYGFQDILSNIFKKVKFHITHASNYKLQLISDIYLFFLNQMSNLDISIVEYFFFATKLFSYNQPLYMNSKDLLGYYQLDLILFYISYYKNFDL